MNKLKVFALIKIIIFLAMALFIGLLIVDRLNMNYVSNGSMTAATNAYIAFAGILVIAYFVFGILQIVGSRTYKNKLSLASGILSVIIIFPYLFFASFIIDIIILFSIIRSNESFADEGQVVTIHKFVPNSKVANDDHEITAIKNKLEKEKLEHEYEELQHKKAMLAKEREKHKTITKNPKPKKKSKK